MKAFLAGIALMLVLAAITGVAYDMAAVSSAEGYADDPAVHVDRG